MSGVAGLLAHEEGMRTPPSTHDDVMLLTSFDTFIPCLICRSIGATWRDFVIPSTDEQRRALHPRMVRCAACKHVKSKHESRGCVGCKKRCMQFMVVRVRR